MESRRPRGRVVKATTTPPTNPHPNPPPQSVTEAPEKPIVTATRENARPKKKRSSNQQQLLNGLLRSLRRKQPRVQKPRPPHLQQPAWWSPPKVPPTHSRKSHISSITFPSMHVWGWLVGFSRSSHPPHRGSSPSRCAEDRHSFCGRIWQHALGGQRCKALRFASWNTDGVRGKKLELEHFLSQYGVDICLLSAQPSWSAVI